MLSIHKSFHGVDPKGHDLFEVHGHFSCMFPDLLLRLYSFARLLSVKVSRKTVDRIASLQCKHSLAQSQGFKPTNAHCIPHPLTFCGRASSHMTAAGLRCHPSQDIRTTISLTNPPYSALLQIQLHLHQRLQRRQSRARDQRRLVRPFRRHHLWWGSCCAYLAQHLQCPGDVRRQADVLRDSGAQCGFDADCGALRLLG